jgi:putative FmdB family regulatory protein
MPIYAYRCATCGHAKDVLQKMSDPVLTVCPACGAPTFEKQVTAAGFQLKGSGWYVTDFKGDKKPPSSTKGDDKGEGEGAKGDSAKGDGANAEGAKGDGAKGDGAKGDGAKSDSTGGAEKAGSSKSESAPAPAAPSPPPAAPPSTNK